MSFTDDNSGGTYVEIESYGNPIDEYLTITGIRSFEEAVCLLDTFERVWKKYSKQWPERFGYKAQMRAAAQGAVDRFARAGSMARHAGNQSTQWRAICTLPDCCRVGKSIVSFDSSADLGQAVTHSPNVKAQVPKNPLYRVGDVFKEIQGDAGAHLVSGTSQGTGHVKIMSGQETVRVNGKAIAQDGSLCKMNCTKDGFGGTLGKLVTQRQATPLTDAPSQTLKEGSSAHEWSWWDRFSGGFSDSVDDALDRATQTWEDVKSAGAVLVQAVGFDEEAKQTQARIYNGVTDTLQSAWDTIAHVFTHPLETVGAITDATTEAIQKAYDEGGSARVLGVGLGTLLAEVVGGKGVGMATGTVARVARKIPELPNAPAAPSSGQLGSRRSEHKQSEGSAADQHKSDQEGRGNYSGYSPATQALLRKADKLDEDIQDARRRLENGDSSVSPDDIKRMDKERKQALEEARREHAQQEGVNIKQERLLPNHTYTINGYSYKTDAQGRVVSVEGELSLKTQKNLSTRHETAQREVGRDDGRLPGDHGGHLIADRFNGFGGAENLVPMDGKVNRAGGEYWDMENRWAKALEKGQTVQVKIEPVYTDGTMRPSSFRVTEWVDGKRRDLDIPNG